MAPMGGCSKYIQLSTKCQQSQRNPCLRLHQGVAADFSEDADSTDSACVEQSCASYGHKYKRCVVVGARKVTNITLSEQQSRTECVFNDNYGKVAGDIWVSRGCRATFKVCYKPASSKYVEVECQTTNAIQDERVECIVNEKDDPKIKSLTVLSHSSQRPCIEGHSFWAGKHKVVVDHFCSATFRVYF
ncbi:hypothetical protein ScPMuIL_016865 [Solemya velum]